MAPSRAASKISSGSTLSLKSKGRIHEIPEPQWRTAAILIGRLIFAAVFLMAVAFKFMDIGTTAGYIAAAGFPFPLFLAWCAAMLEAALVLCFLTGAFFSQAALVAAAYVLFLGFAFHGPSHWAGNQSEFGFFVDHFTFLAGLLFAAVHGPGRVLALPYRISSALNQPREYHERRQADFHHSPQLQGAPRTGLRMPERCQAPAELVGPEGRNAS